MLNDTYRIDDAAMWVRKETADDLRKQNLKVVFTQADNAINPRKLEPTSIHPAPICTILGIDVPLKGDNKFNSYDDFAEQFFSATGQSVDRFYYTGVMRDKGRIVTVQSLDPWSVSKSIGIIYVSESDVLSQFFKTGQAIEVGQFGADLHIIAVEAMENEISLYSAFANNNIHDVTVSTIDGSRSHTVKQVYGLPSLTNNNASGTYAGLNSLIDDAVRQAQRIVLTDKPT